MLQEAGKLLLVLLKAGLELDQLFLLLHAGLQCGDPVSELLLVT